jgi:hypothetical protein
MADKLPPQEITLDEIRRLAAAASPDLAAAVKLFLEQPDPPPAAPLPDGALTLEKFEKELRSAKGKRKRKHRREKAKEAWHTFMAQGTAPPRFQLAELLVEWYESGNEPAREAILSLVADARFRWGLWGGIKRIYKRAEVKIDGEMMGALTARVSSYRQPKQDVSSGTLKYLSKRARRWYGSIRRAMPEIYPQLVVAAGRSLDETSAYLYGVFANEQKSLDNKLYPPAPVDAWKRSPAPLLTLLEEARNNEVANYAIGGLRALFPDVLRSAEPAWLARLARRSLASVHEFVVATLQGSPELHQGKLKALGLHDAVVALLASPSQKVRTYAIEYARAHATDLPATRLAELAELKLADVTTFANDQLRARAPRDLGVRLLGRLIGIAALTPRDGKSWMRAALDEGFATGEVPADFLVDMIVGQPQQRAWATEWFKAKYKPGELGPDVWKLALADRRCAENYQANGVVTTALQGYTAASLGAEWLLDALQKPGGPQTVANTVLRRAESIPGLDVEKVKGLVFNPAHRPLALAILGNTKIVRPRDLGLAWLLALARRPDPSLHEFAHRYLLQFMTPADFEGTDRLFALATGEKEPEPVRAFAQTYLRCHHPAIGPEQPESKALQLTPQVPREAYTAEKIWGLFGDMRADVRRFAITIARAELRRWNRHVTVYELTDSTYKEVRQLAYDALSKAGVAGADPASTLTPEELSPAGVFAMTESRVRETREVGVELVRKHYARLGGVSRLAWLMESADRTVRLVAVKLLWEKHRPRHLPEGWKPKGGTAPEDAGRFGDVAAMRDFLRRTMFGLPPGREREPGEASGLTRRISAGDAKRNLVEVIRDLGVEDEAFARVAAPVFLEFTGAFAKGEWQACLAALMTLRHAHPTLAVNS